MVSRIIGMSGLYVALWPCAQRMTDRLQPRTVLGRPVCRAAKIERLVLRVAFAEAPGDLGLHQFGTEIERMRAVGCDLELAEQRECILLDVMALAVIDVDTVCGDLDAE